MCGLLTCITLCGGLIKVWSQKTLKKIYLNNYRWKMISLSFWNKRKSIFSMFPCAFVRAKPMCMLGRTHTVYTQQSADISFSFSFIYSSLMVLLALTRPRCVRHFWFELDSGWKMAGDFLQALGRDLKEKLVGDSWNELSETGEKNQWTNMNNE